MDIFKESIKGTATTQATYVGVNVKYPTHDAKKNLDLLDKLTIKNKTVSWTKLGVLGPNSLLIGDMMQRMVNTLLAESLLYRHLPIHHLHAWHSSRDLL